MLSYPFTSQVTYDDYGQPLYDRAVDSEFLRKVFRQYFSDGIFYTPTNSLQVVIDTGMQVAVEPGACHIQGAMGIEESRRTLVVQASEEQDRIDTVVARLDLSLAARSIDLYIVKGVAAVSPQPPALTRDATTWELGLANIFVAKNTQAISQQRITDTRLDTSRCGIVAQTIGSLDTAPYFAQLTAAIASHQDEAEAQIKALQDAIAAVEGDTAWMMQALYDPQGFKQDVFAYSKEPASDETFGAVKLSDTPDSEKLAADGWAASPAAVDTVDKKAASVANRTGSLESRVKTMNYMRPGDPATDSFLHAMGTGGAAADATWERATDGNDYLVFTVQGTRVFAVRGFSGINII